VKEVACKVLDVFFREIRRKGLSEEVLLAGVPATAAHLRDRHERIDWAVFLRFMENVRSVWTDD
jgi:hypothetical protein